MNYNNEFLQLYKQFEDWAKTRFPDMQEMSYLERNYTLKDYCKTLEFYRRVRNILTHYGQIGTTPVPDMVHVTGDLLKEFNSFFAEISEPAINRAVQEKNIISYTKEDRIFEAALDMVKRNYTHCPIVSEGKIIGLFGENSLFNIICKGIILNANTTFGEILEEINIYKCPIAKSITQDATIPECKYKFTRAVEKNDRLDILFFTEDGTYRTALKGLITVWDMPAINKNVSRKD